MKRVTDQNLYAVCDRINRVCGTPRTAYTRNPDGTCSPNAGAYLIDHAYGGVSLHRMLATTGEDDVLSCGHVSKRELYNMMFAFIAGFDAARNNP